MKVRILFSNQLKGGLGDNETVHSLAIKYGISDDDDVLQKLNKGIKIEAEHTDDPSLAEEIAMDHLTEDINSYDKEDYT